jgi:hypothetical protein
VNKNINFILTILLLIIVSLSNLKAQEAEILSIDPSEYPKIKTEFKLIGYDDREVRSFTKQDLKLFDNFTEKTDLTLPVCDEADPTDYSALLILDISNSMDRSLDPNNTDPDAPDRISVVMDVVNDWIDLLDGATSEAALVSFAGAARLLQGFTSDKNKLRSGLGQVVGLEQWTNYNAAFFVNPSGDSSQSAVRVMRDAKYTPVIIFLTDGQHNAPEQEAFNIAGVEAWAKAIGCHIFVIKIGAENISVSRVDLIKMAQIQGHVDDYFYDDIYESEQLEEVYDLIRTKCRDLGEDPPCYSYYNAACDGGGDVFMNFPLYNDLRTESVTFTIPPERKPYLEISPRHLRIEAADLDGGSFVQDITITARYNKSNLHGFVPSDSRFDIDWKGNDPIKSLAVDESVIVGISYTPDDSLYTEVTLSFEGSACDSLDFTAGAFLMPHPNDIDMGTAMMFVDPIEKDVTEVMFNRTGADLLIEEVRIVGDDAADFKVLTSIQNFTLKSEEALSVKFSFGPLGMGYRSSTVEIVTADHVYTSTIHGNGEGEPGLSSVNPFVFRNTNCADYSRDTVIVLTNTGMKDLNITSMEIIPAGSDFTLGTWDKTIEPAGSIDVQIIFNADDSAPKTAVLRVNSDAPSNPEYDINLEGTKDSVSFATASNSVDIGDLCNGESVSKTITIENTGTIPIEITASSATGNVTFPNGNNILIPVGLSEELSFDCVFAAGSDGDFTETIILEDDLCGTSASIDLNGVASVPKIQSDFDVIMTSDILVPKAEVVKLYNESSVPMDFSNVNLFKASVFSMNILSTNSTIAPGDFFELELTYLPDLSVIEYDSLIVEGSPCDFRIVVEITGNPSMPTAEIFVDNHTGVIGQEIEIPVHIRNSDRFAESLTTTVSADISVNALLLEAISPTPAGTVAADTRTINIDFPVQSTNDDQDDVYILHFKVLNAGAIQETDIAFSNVKSDKNNVVFSSTNGFFAINPASAVLSIGQHIAEPGDFIDIPIYISNVLNISSIDNETITADFRYKYAVMEPVGSTKSGELVNDERIIPIEVDIPNGLGADQKLLTTLTFRAMLGTVAETDLILDNISVSKGSAMFEFDMGHFVLGGVCQNGEVDRFFDPEGEAFLQSINPNPSTGNVIINYSVAEEAMTTITVVNYLGETVYEILNEVPQKRKSTINKNLSHLGSGMYFIVLRTATQTISRRLYIVK